MLIRTRLTLQFLLIGGLIMIVSSIAIYFFSSDFRRNEFGNMLRARAVNTAKLVLDSYEFNANLALRSRTGYPGRLPDEKIIILNSDNDTLYISDKNWEFKKLSSVIARVKLNKEFFYKQDDYEVLGTSHNNGSYRFVVVAAAIDIDGNLYMEKLLAIMLIVCLASLILFSIGGWFYSGRALKPISKVLENVDNISITSLNLRVPEGNGLDEIGMLARTFNRMLERLETSFATQKDFIANASHELRTPLTSINGQIEVLLMKDRSVSEYKSVLESVLEDLRSLIDLSNKLLLIARTSAERPEKQFKKVRIDEILWQAHDEIRKFNKDFHIDISLDKSLTDSGQMTLMGDEYLLKIACSNLIDNACKYSSDHSVSIKLSNHEQHIEILFEDRGIGIWANETGKIFEPFYRGSNTGSVRGTGVGLSLVDSIIRNHNGAVKVSSVPGKGTTFKIQLRSVG